MADEPIQNEDESEPGDGTVLPKRELMSVISTDPADPMYSALVPADAPIEGPMDGQAAPLPRPPVEPEVE